MNNIIAFIRRKLSVRLSLLVVIFAAIIFYAALGFFVMQARKAVQQEAISRATQILDKTSLRVEGILNRVEVASNMTKWLVQLHTDQPDSMFAYSRGMLLNNPDFYNCSIAFEPYHFKDKGRYFSAYTKHDGDSIRTIQGGSDQYQYFYVDWYLLPKQQDKPCWTEPYIDFDAPTNTYEMVTSYGQTLKDKHGQIIGVINTSLSITWLAQTISAIRPYPNSYSIMIGQAGTYFAHPDTTKITRQTIFTEAQQRQDTALITLGHAMQRGEEGMKHINIDAKDCYVFYKPLGQTGCSMAIVCPESDIFSGFNRLQNSVMAIFWVGLLLMLFLFIRIITHELKPLNKLAQGAETIAAGQLHAQLPELQRIDEIGLLSNAFARMQQSLTTYIRELKDTTAQKASIERELSIARSIQMAMLPKTFPPLPDCQQISIYGQLTPAKAVGGDLYDFYIRDNKLFFCIGDVSGKGIPASLVMAVTKALFRNISAHEQLPHRILAQISDTITHDNELNMFVTLFVGVLDITTGILLYSNAGHDAPLIITPDAQHITPLTVDSNIPAGITPRWEFTLQQTTIHHGTTIFLYTDGLTEAENTTHDQFGDIRITQTLQLIFHSPRPDSSFFIHNSSFPLPPSPRPDSSFFIHNSSFPLPPSPRSIVEEMVAAVQAFVGDAEQSDDLTLMAIQYDPSFFIHNSSFFIHNSSFFTHNSSLNSSSLTLPCDINTIPQLHHFVDTVAHDAKLPPALTNSINLALEEAVVNVMLYAYTNPQHATVTIYASHTQHTITFVITDTGQPFDPTTKDNIDTNAPPHARPIGGLGIHLIRQIMDTVTYQRTDNHNILTLTKNINNS